MTPARKAEVFRSWGLTALPWQAEAHSAQTRFLVCDCGRRAGKTAFAGREAALQCMVPESRVWIVAPEMNLGEKAFRVVWDLAVRKELIPVEGKSRREHWIEFRNGSKIEVRTEENPDQLIGEGVDLMVVDEAALFKPQTWDSLLRPTLADRPGRAIFTSTPRGRNFFYRLWTYGQSAKAASDAGEDPREWKSWQLPTAVNPTILRSDIERIDRLIESDPVTYATERQEWRAEFISYAGIVFPEFSHAVHVRREPYVPGNKTMLWIDPGFTHPYAVLLVQVTGDETVRVLSEVYRTGRTTDEVIGECERKWPHVMFEGGVVGNNPNPELEIIVDEAAAESIASWRMKGYHAYGIKPPLRTGLEVYHRMLRDPFRHADASEENPLGIWPRITFDPQCVHAIEEHNLYHYPDEARRRSEFASEVPVDADNHALSAIRYGLFALWPELFNERVPEVSVHTFSEEELEQLGFDRERITIATAAPEDYLGPGEDVWSLGEY